MDYYSLNVELASVECDKALLLCEAQEEIAYVNGDDFYEEKSDDGIIKKAMKALQDLVGKIKDWFRKHFSKSKKMYLPENEAKEYTKLQKAARKLKNAVSSPYAWKALGAVIGAGLGVGAVVHQSKAKKAYIQNNDEMLEKQLEKMYRTNRAVGVAGKVISVGSLGAMAARAYRNNGNAKKPAPVVGELKALGVENIEDDYLDIAKKLEADYKKGKISGVEYRKKMVMLRHALNMCYRYATHAKTEEDVKGIRLSMSGKGNPKAIKG